MAAVTELAVDVGTSTACHTLLFHYNVGDSIAVNRERSTLGNALQSGPNLF